MTRSDRTRIKICGLTRESDVRRRRGAGADALGFVFYPPSPRYVTPQRGRNWRGALPPPLRRGPVRECAQGRDRGDSGSGPPVLPAVPRRRGEEALPAAATSLPQGCPGNV